jgi:hypothetical protein
LESLPNLRSGEQTRRAPPYGGRRAEARCAARRPSLIVATEAGGPDRMAAECYGLSEDVLFVYHVPPKGEGEIGRRWRSCSLIGVWHVKLVSDPLAALAPVWCHPPLTCTGLAYLTQPVQSRPAPPAPMAMARGSEENPHIKPLNLHPRCDHQPNPQRLP